MMGAMDRAPAGRFCAAFFWWRATGLVLLIAVAALAFAGCAGGQRQTESAPRQEAPPEQAAYPEFFATQFGIGADLIVLLSFAQAMNPRAVFLGGDLEPESDGGVWSSTVMENDTLIVSPLTEWSPGERSLSITLTHRDWPDFTSVLYFSL